MRLSLLAILIWVAASSCSFAQGDVTLEPSTARFIYFAPPEGPGIPGGLPNPFELHFGLQGSFTIVELPGNAGDVTQADFKLIGNDAAFQNDPARRADLETIAEQLLLMAPFTVEHGPPLDRTVFRAPFIEGRDLELEFFRQTLVRMEGGPDQRPVDGPAFQFVYPIPEPKSMLMLMAACCGLMLCRSVGTLHAMRRAGP